MNVVVLVMDTARADSCEPGGAPAGATPTIAQLGRSGRALPWVRSTANWTVPGHASMFSGEMPRTLGVTQVPGQGDQCRPAIAAVQDRWLPEVLRRSGYDTGGVSTNLWITKRTGFDHGFDWFRRVKGQRSVKMSNADWRGRLKWDLQGVRARVDDGADEAWRLAREWLTGRRDQDRPFFLFVNLGECHSPYLPPRPYNDLSPLKRLRAAEEARQHLTRNGIWRVNLAGAPVPDDALARMRHLYGQAVRSMDDWVTRLLEHLDESAKLEETIVIVTSDHGENLGENGLLGHCFTLDDRLLRVPFVVSDPAFPEISSLASVPAAVATRLGIDDHPYGEVGDAISVAQMDPMAGRDDPKIEVVRKEWGLDETGIARMTDSLTSAADAELKLIRNADGRDVLYDVTSDPLEERPLDLEAAVRNGVGPRVRALRAAIDDCEREVDAERLEAIAGRSLAADVDSDEADDIAARMEMLGYL